MDQIRANVKFLLYNYFRSSICNLKYYYYAYCQCLQQLSETLQGSRKHTFLVTTRVWKSYYCGKIYWSFHWNGGKDCRSLKRSDGYLFRIRNGIFFIMERCDSLKWDFNGCKLHPMIHRYDMYFRLLGQIPISLLKPSLGSCFWPLGAAWGKKPGAGAAKNIRLFPIHTCLRYYSLIRKSVPDDISK